MALTLMKSKNEAISTMGIFDFIKEMWDGPPKKKKVGPERRTEPREILNDATITINDNTYPMQDWSKSGYCFGPSDLEASTGQRLDASFVIPIGSETLAFSCRITLLREVSDDGSFAGTFLNVDDAIQRKVEAHFRKVGKKS
jgi:hypothetical protein